MGTPSGKEVALLQVEQARKKRDAARARLADAQDELTEAILAAAAVGCSLREIAERANVSFQRVSKIVRSVRDVNPD